MEKPIRILQVIGIVCGGGVENVVMNYYRHIDKSKVQFDFIVDGYGDCLIEEEIKHLGGKIYKIEPYKSNIFKYVYQIYKIIKNNQYTIVHSHMNTLSVFSLLAAYLAGVKTRIVHNHATGDITERKRYILKILLRPFSRFFANEYCACSKHAAEWMFGCLENIKIIPNAICLRNFRYNCEVRRIKRKELSISEDILAIVHVGRLTAVKNHKFLLDVFKEILNINNKVRLFLVGDGELRDEIIKKVQKLDIREKVVFLGIRQDINELLQAMDVCVLPSLFEGFSLVSLEAQATSLPIVVSDRITKEVELTKYINFISLNDPIKHWAKTVLDLSDLPRNNSHENKLEYYDITNCSEKLVAWYENLWMGQKNVE